MLYINEFDGIEATKYNSICEYVICTRAPSPTERPFCCIILNQRQFNMDISLSYFIFNILPNPFVMFSETKKIYYIFISVGINNTYS